MNPLIKKVISPLIPLSIVFASAAHADPVINFHNPYLNKDFPNVDCAIRKVDMCKFGNSIDGNNICKMDDFLNDVDGNLQKANGLAIFANFEHGAAFHKEDCIGQHTRTTMVNIYNSAAEIIRLQTALDQFKASGNTFKINENTAKIDDFYSGIEKFINGAKGETDGLVHMSAIAAENGGRLDNPQAFIAMFEPAIPALLEAHEQKDAQKIISIIMPLLSKQNLPALNGQCAPITAMQQCKVAEQYLTQ